MDDVVYPATAVANEFLRRARESRRALSATQLHELVYCAHGWHLAVADQPLISGPVAAHRGGVYIPDLRAAGCWGVEPVTGLLHKAGDEQSFPRVDAGTPARFTIDHVWEDYGPLSRYDLTRFTLVERGPWDQVWNADGLHESALIPNRLLREWFGQVDTWRVAAEHVSLAVDRFFQDRPDHRAPLVLDARVAARPAENQAMTADRTQVHELRQHNVRAAAHAG